VSPIPVLHRPSSCTFTSMIFGAQVHVCFSARFRKPKKGRLESLFAYLARRRWVVIFTGMSAASRPSSATRHKNQFLTLQDSPRSASLHRSVSIVRPRRLLIVKFGGSSLSNQNRINLAVASVAREYSRGSRVVIVVSAV